MSGCHGGKFETSAAVNSDDSTRSKERLEGFGDEMGEIGVLPSADTGRVGFGEPGDDRGECGAVELGEAGDGKLDSGAEIADGEGLCFDGGDDGGFDGAGSEPDVVQDLVGGHAVERVDDK